MTVYEQRLRELLTRTPPPPLPELYRSADTMVAAVHLVRD